MNYTALAGLILVGYLSCSKEACFKSENTYTSHLIVLNDFDTLAVFNKLHIEIIPDTSNFIEIIAQDYLLDQILVEESQNRLILSNQNTCEWTRNYLDSVFCRLHVKSLHFIDYQANGTLFANDTLHAGVFTISCKEGGGHVNLLLNTNSCHIALNSGVADVTVRGQTHNIYAYSNASTGIIHTEQLQAFNAYCSNNNTGDFWVQCSAILNATINHSGSIYYEGNPIITRAGDGLGEVLKK